MTEAQKDVLAISVDMRDESDVVMARVHVREVAKRQGLTEQQTEALVLAVSEVARNILDHAFEGVIAIHSDHLGGRTGVVVVATDRGPGIEQLERAMDDGFSTRGGLGLGLAAARRLVDEFEVVSSRTDGTTITMRRWARPNET